MKKWEKNHRLQNGAIRGLQIGAVLGITDWGKRDYKLGQLKGFQIRTKR